MKDETIKKFSSAVTGALFLSGAVHLSVGGYQHLSHDFNKGDKAIEQVEDCKNNKIDVTKCTLEDYKTAYEEEKFLRSKETTNTQGWLLLALGLLKLTDDRKTYKAAKKPKAPTV